MSTFFVAVTHTKNVFAHQKIYVALFALNAKLFKNLLAKRDIDWVQTGIKPGLSSDLIVN
jgi:hypothetical protein